MKKTRGLFLLFSPGILAGLWLLASVVLYLIAIIAPASIDALIVIKGFVNRLLWMLGLLSIAAVIVGIVLLSINKEAKITVKEAISYGWKESKKHVTKFLLWIGIWVALQVVNSILNPQNVEVQTLLWVITGFVVQVLDIWIMLWLMKISLDIVYGRKYAVTHVFVGFWKTVKYIVAYILNAIIALVGFLLLIIPGVIWSIKLSLVPYLILEKNYGPFKAIKISWKMTTWFTTDMFAILIIGGLINILGLLALVVWLIWTIPLLLIANAYVYKKIAEAHKHMLVD